MDDLGSTDRFAILGLRNGETDASDMHSVCPAGQYAELHLPISIRSISLMLIAAITALFALRWASEVFIPLMVGVLFSYALSPMVDVMQSWRIPRTLSAALLIVGIVLGASVTVYTLIDEANRLIELLPEAANKMRNTVIAPFARPDNPLATVQQAAAQIEQAAAETAREAPPARSVQKVQIVNARFNIQDHLWSGTLGLLTLLGQLATVTLITFLLLASGDQFRRKMVKLAGPTLSNKKVTVQALNEIHHQIQRYLLVQLFTSVLVGIGTFLVFMAIGLENAAVWGLAAGVLNLIPYVGSVLITVGSSMVALFQYSKPEMALLVGGVSLAIHATEAFLLTPWLASRANKINSLAIFIGVLAWGWLWGVWGMLLAVPILVVIKVVCDRVEDFKSIGELLGN